MIRSVVVSICVLTLAAFCPVSPQTQEIAKAEFEEITRRGYDNLAEHPHRITITDQRNDIRDGDIISQTIEKESSNRWKNVSVFKTATGTRREERIRVDDQEYVKIGDDPWREPGKDSNSFSAYGDPANLTKTEEFRATGSEGVGGKQLRVVERIMNLVFRTAERTTNSEHVQRYWIDQDGRFIREESKSSSNGRLSWHSTKTYEYDPKIKIALPIQPKKY